MPNLIFPDSILSQHLVVLGKTGAGKSSALRHIVEHLLEQKKRVCIIDPKGDWYGLKSSADGKGAGFPVVLFGDFKNPDARDVPVNEFSGRPVAELVVGGNRPCVVGFRGWTQGEMHRFWIDFASVLFNQNAGELYFIVDEVHNFAPKGKVLSPEIGKCLHWANRIMNEGRGIGLVNLIASQRPQKVHNDTLTACETLVAMRVVHKADRDAIEDWVKGCGDAKQGNEVLNALAGMKRGEAFVWSPEAGFGPERLTFPMFTTYDSFAPPQLLKKISQKGWADVDLSEVKTKLASAIEKARASDPKELQKKVNEANKRIAELEKQLAKPAAATTEIKEVPAVDQETVRHFLTAVEVVGERVAALREIASSLDGKANEIKASLARVTTNGHRSSNAQPTRHRTDPVRLQSLRPNQAQPAGADPRDRSLQEGGIRLSRKQHEILDAIAWYESIGNLQPTNIQVGAIALIDATGGHFSNTVGPLTSAGLVERGNGKIWLTGEGRAIAKVPDNIASLNEYHDVLRNRVRKARQASGRTVDVLNSIISHGGSDVSTAQIGEDVGIDHTGGHFSNTIGPLSTLGLIERTQGVVRPTDVLFPPGLG